LVRSTFFLQSGDNSVSSCILSANPHYYDYIHSLVFKDDGSVELVDGAGQLINAEAVGKYRVRDIDASSVEVEFYDVIEVNPYQKDRRLRDIAPFKVKVLREEGVFPFRQEVVWKINDETEWPCLLYRARYVFDSDPLAFARAKQARNLYYLLEDKDLIDAARYYYLREDRQELTAKEMLALGIPKEAFW
jgi:hypothetical protein